MDPAGLVCEGEEGEEEDEEEEDECDTQTPGNGELVNIVDYICSLLCIYNNYMIIKVI